MSDPLVDELVQVMASRPDRIDRKHYSTYKGGHYAALEKRARAIVNVLHKEFPRELEQVYAFVRAKAGQQRAGTVHASDLKPETLLPFCRACWEAHGWTEKAPPAQGYRTAILRDVCASLNHLTGYVPLNEAISKESVP